jgi:hypothetical protein
MNGPDADVNSLVVAIMRKQEQEPATLRRLRLSVFEKSIAKTHQIIC